jgi:hypothetical protein
VVKVPAGEDTQEAQQNP